MKHFFNTVLVLMLVLSSLSAQAANLYWDGGAVDIGGNGNDVSAGGSGTWNTTIKNWDQSGVPYIAWPVGANANQAFFAGSGGTVTFGSDMGPAGAYPNSVFVTAGNYVFDLGANGLSFRGSGLQVSGGTLVLTNGTVTLLNSGVTVSGANALKVYSKVSSSGVVTFSKFGAGDVYLYNDANDFSGKLFGQNGNSVYFTSIKNSGVASAAGAGNTLETGYNNNMVYIGPGDTTDRTLSLIGNGYYYLKNNGTGPLVWTGPLANSSVVNPILNIGGSNTGTNEFRGALSNSVSSALNVEKVDAGTWILSGTNTFTGDLDIYGGILRLGGAGQLGGGTYASPNSIYIASGAIFDFSSSATQTISSGFINAGGITVNGPGILTLSGNNTYSGATIISNGTLKAGSTTAIPSTTALSVMNAGVLDLNGFNATVASVGAGSSTAVITNSAAGSGTNTLTISTFNVNFAPRIVEGAGQKIAVVMGNNNAVPSLTNPNNTFSGGLIISSVGGATRLWQGTITTVTNADGSIRTCNLGSGPVTIGTTTGGAQLGNIPANTQIRNPIVFNASTYLDGGSAAIRADSTGIQLYGQLTANLSPVNMSCQNSGSVNALGQITGPSGLQLKTPGAAGTFTLTLSNITASANNYQGPTMINPRTVLALGKNEQIPNGVSAGNVTNTGTFNLNGFSETINGLSGTGIVDGVSGTPTLTIGDNNATGVSNTFAGVFTDTAGALAVSKIGSGILTLTGVNTHSGATAVNVGTLLVNGSGVLGSGSAVSVANAATLGGNGTINGAVSVASGGFLSAGSATGTIGKLTLGSTLALNGASLTFDLNTPGTAGTDYDQIAVAGALTMSGVNTININVLGGYIVDGTYTLLTFGTSTASTFTFANGTTTMIFGGATLNLINSTTGLQLSVVGAPQALKWKGNVSTVWDTGTANWLNGGTPATFTAGSDVTFDDSASTFTVTGSGAPATMVFTNNSNAYTVSANIAGVGATLRKTGTKELTLSGTNTYSGGSTLLAGTTTVRSATALGTGLIQLGDSGFVSPRATLNLDSPNMDLQNDLYIQRWYTSGNLYFHQDTQSISGDIDIDMPTFDSFRIGARNDGNDVLSIYGSISARSASGGISFDSWEYNAGLGGTVRLYGDNSDLRGRLAIDTASKLEVYHNNALGSRYPVTVEMGWNSPSLRIGQGVRVGTNAVVSVDQAWPVNLNGYAVIEVAPGATSAELAASFSNQVVNAGGGNPVNFYVGNGQTLNVSGNLNGTGNWLVNGNGRVVFSGSGSTATGRFRNDVGWVEFGHPNALAAMAIESWNNPKYSASSAGMTVPNNTFMMAANTSYYSGTNDFTMAGTLQSVLLIGNPYVNLDSSASVTFAGDVGVGTYLGTNGVNRPIFYKTGSGNLRFTHTDPEVDSLTLSNASGRIELGANTLLTMFNGNEIWSYTGGTITGGTLTTKAGGDGQLAIRNYGASNLVIDSQINYSNAVNHVTIVDVMAFGSGAIKLSNTNNTFSQGQVGGCGVQIWSGVLETDRIGNHLSPSPLGGGQFPADGRVFFSPSAGSNAILRYTGPGESANREFFAFGSAPSLHKIEASGSGDLILTAGYFGAGGGATKTWALGGTGTGILRRFIYDPSAVRKVDSGTWKFDTIPQFYAGTTLIEGGLFVMNTRYDSNGAWSVSSGAILAGNGSIKAALTVNGVLSPGDNGLGTFNVSNNVTWGSTPTPGVATDWQWDLGASDTADLLNINGDFLKSGSGSFRFNVGGSPSIGTYTLVQWTGSTTFSATDFSVTGLQGGQSASFAIVGKTLVLSIGNCSGGTPTITLGNSPATCGSGTRSALPYLSTTLDPIKYTINYDATAITAGFTNITAKQPLGIINDNFSSGSVVTNDSRFRENDIDGGWQACQANVGLSRPGSAWKITGGKLQNDATNTVALGYPNYMPGVTPVIQAVTLAGRSGSSITLSFDYSVGSGDTLYVHLRGLTGEFDLNGDYIANLEESGGLSMSEVLNPETDETSPVRKYNFKDGSQTMNGTGAAITALTGSGTYSTNINIASLGISGIDDIADFGYVLLAFQKGEDGTAGNTTIDNMVLTSGSLPIALPGALPNGTYNGTLTVYNDNNCSGSTNFTVTITDSAPSTPGSISGTARVCVPDTIAYSIAPVPGAVGYVWSIPANATTATINQTETEIVVNWVSGGEGSVSVYAEGGCALAPTSGTRTLTVIADAATPVAPTALAAANITQSGFDARWNALSTAQGFYLDMASLPDFSAASIVVSNEARTGTSRTFTGLANGNYYYRLRAYNACGTSPNSGIITVTVSQVIANWDTSTQPGGAGNYGTSPLAPQSYAATYVTVTGLTRQAGVATDGTGAVDGWGGEGWSALNKAAAESANDAMTFTIMPIAGVNVNYTTIDVLSYMRQVNGPTDGMLQYALNNGSFVDIGPLTYPSTAAGGATVPEAPIDLSAVSALQNVNVPVTFRIVNWGASDAAADWYIFDQNQSTSPDLQVLGSFCLSPTAYAMTGGGVYCLPSGTAPSIGLAGSQANVAYQLYINTGAGPVADGSAVAGTGSALNFGVKSATGTYTVVATRLSGSGCSANMSGSAVVTEATTPAVPTGLTATFDGLGGDIELAWSAASGATNYAVSRATIPGGPYTVIANRGTTSYSDASVIRNTIEYFYVVAASSSGCASAYSAEDSATTDSVCPPGVAPTLTAPGDRTVNVGQSVQHAITATDSATACATPNISQFPASLPSYITYVDTPSGSSITRTYTIAPSPGDNGDAQPIRVLTWDNDANAVTNEYSFMVYVGSSASNSYYIPITALAETTPGSAADLTWETDEGISYDVHSTTTPPGANPVWTKIKSAVPADDISVTETVVANGQMRFYQVAPAGVPRTDRGVWGIVRPSVPGGAITYMSPPVPETASDLDFSGNLGDALAVALTDPDDRIYVMSPGTNPGWTTLRLAVGEWIIDGGGAYTTPLNPGQGFMIYRDSGSASPTFSGPVGNDGQSSNVLSVGYNIIGISEGRSLSASTAFESASPVGNYDEEQADQVVILNSNGSFRRLIRLGNNTWYDTATKGTTTLTLMPGQAYYYLRRSSGATLSF